MNDTKTVKINYNDNNETTFIYISLKEYKELLEYKGRYLELKDRYDYPKWNYPNITYGDQKRTGDLVPPYRFTCTNCSEERE